MKQHDKDQGSNARRAYVAPQLRRVRLVPEEAVLASCKNQTTSGPTGHVGKCIAEPSVCFMNAS